MLKPPSTTTQNLIKARELIADEKNWCQGAYSKGHRHCARSALGIAANKYDPNSEVFVTLDRAAMEMVGGSGSLGSMVVNDTLGHAATLRMFDRAIELSLQDAS